MTTRPPSDAPRSPRIFRVHGSCYHHDEMMEAPNTHTDDRLADVAAMGFDGVWIHANLKWLAPTALFEPYVDRVDERLAALNIAIARARRHGIGIWLYLNEPRGFPADHPFWQAHPECAGHLYDNNSWDIGWPWAFKRQPCRAMCLSEPRVPAFVTGAIERLLRAAPDLAGIVTITQSEHPTHCYSKVPGNRSTNCSRCAGRDRLEMPATVLRSMIEGLRAAGSWARLAAWSWTWHALAPDPQPALLATLPTDVALLVDYERGQPVERAGVKYEIDEYAFAIPGPSQRFKSYLTAANNREVWAKLQIGATHELATMPNIPACASLYDKVASMRAAGVSGTVATWTMGLRPTVNAFIAGRLLAHQGELPSRRIALRNLAAEYFSISQTDADYVVDAWEQFTDAISFFPTTMAMCYHSPVNYAPAFPWKLKREGSPMARSWTPEPWGDKLEQSLGPLTMAQAAMLLGEIARRWNDGLPAYRKALEPAAGQNERARQEWSVAQACGLFYDSCRGAYAFAHAVDSGAPASELSALIRHEIEVCGKTIALLETDDRLGWHDDFGSMIRPDQVRQKIAGLEQILATVSPGATAGD